MIRLRNAAIEPALKHLLDELDESAELTALFC